MTLAGPASLPAFPQAVAAVSATGGAIALARLDAWRSGAVDQWRQVVANIEAETALSVDDLVALLTDFASELTRGLQPPHTCWIQVCWRHQFKGPRVPSPSPAIVGRATPIGGHAKVVSDSPGASLSPDQCEALLRKVAMAGAAAMPRDMRVLCGASLGSYVLWATFCSAKPGDCPFEHLPRTTDAIRTALGLGECAETETLVLVSYETQGSHAALELFRPTIADAGGYHWYRPHPLPAAPHGLTCPLMPNAGGLAPQPEVVHRPATGERLVFPIYLAV